MFVVVFFVVFFVVFVVFVVGETLEIKRRSLPGRDDAVKKKTRPRSARFGDSLNRMGVRARGGRRCRGFGHFFILSIVGWCGHQHIGDGARVYKINDGGEGFLPCTVYTDIHTFVYTRLDRRTSWVLMWTVAATATATTSRVTATRVVSPERRDFDDDDDDGDDDDDEWCQGGGQDDDDARARASARWRARWTRRIAIEGKPRRARGG